MRSHIGRFIRHVHPEWTAYLTQTGVLLLPASMYLEVCDDAEAVFHALLDPAIHETGDGSGRWVNWATEWGHA
jgi:hypothetical protein